jgi:hypothetical protein
MSLVVRRLLGLPVILLMMSACGSPPTSPKSEAEAPVTTETPKPGYPFQESLQRWITNAFGQQCSLAAISPPFHYGAVYLFQVTILGDCKSAWRSIYPDSIVYIRCTMFLRIGSEERIWHFDALEDDAYFAEFYDAQRDKRISELESDVEELKNK